MTAVKLVISSIKLYIKRLSEVADDEEKVLTILHEMRDWVNDQIDDI